MQVVTGEMILMLPKAAGGGLDYITMDFLLKSPCLFCKSSSEKDTSLGFAKDAVVMISDVLEDVINKTKIITNAGGISGACARAILKQANKIVCSLRLLLLIMIIF